MRNRVKTLLAAGKPAFGILSTIPSVPVVQILARSGYDWLLIDMEHGPVDLKSLQEMIVATAGTDAVPLVRVAWAHHWLAKPALDLGALGICFPMIRSREEAETALRALRYPPAGDRLWGPFHAPFRWNLATNDYVAAANDAMLGMVMIENPEAVRNIDAIVGTPGLDIAMLGTGNLASALLVPGQFEHPKLAAAVAEAEAGVLRSKVALGGVARTPDQAKRMLDRGYRLLMLGFDFGLLQAGAAFLDAVRR